MRERRTIPSVHVRRRSARTALFEQCPPPPRSRMFGGDRLLGGSPLGVGHAGRSPQRSSMLAVLFALMVAVACSLAGSPHIAHAATTITFSNGGTATLNSDGSIEGSCVVQRSAAFALYRDGDPNDPGPGVPTPFYVTMPDGQGIIAYCQDGENYAPRNGSIPFTAYPDGATYRVWIWGNRVDVNADEVAAWTAAGRGLYYPAQRLLSTDWKPSITGELKLEKTSSGPEFSAVSSAYSLENAQYGIYADSACTKEVARVSTDANGKAKVEKLDAGTYWVKELSPSEGFALDTKAHKLVITAGEIASLTVLEEPQYKPISLLLTKVDAETHEAVPQGSASLAGARFLVRFFGNVDGDISGTPLRTWLLETDAEGRILMNEEHLVSGDAFFITSSGKVVLPLGTLAVQELSAPAGYYLEGQSSLSDEPIEAPVHTAIISSEGTSAELPPFEAFRIDEQVERGGLAVDKEDAETVFAQGNGQLSGVVFEIANMSENDVVVNGTRYAPGEIVATIVTDESGHASTEPDLLPLGIYEVREAQPGTGYLGTDETRTITVDTPGMIHSVTVPFSNEVVRGGVRVGKVSAETMDHVAQGGASLAGAVFTVTTRSDAPVLVNGALCQPGSIVATLTTGENGCAELANDVLPFGIYEIREVEAPKGYLLNDSWSRTISIDEDGEVEDVSLADLAAPEDVKRGGFSFNKVEEESMESMPLVAFLVTAREDPDGDGVFEQHVIVTDENGIFDSEFFPHSQLTNANDDALDPETGEVDDSKLNPEAGLWFSGRTDCTVDANDERGALPYGTYAVEELPCAANEGRALVGFTLRISRNSHTVERGTIDDKQGPSIETEFSSEAGKVVPASEGPVVLTDLVRFDNLKPGCTYLFSGELVDGETGEPLGISSTREETVSAASGTVALEFAVDPAMLEARRIVAFEELLLDGSCIASHEDLENVDQTVLVPALGTTLTSCGNDVLASSVDDAVTLVDTVSYCGLWSEESYRIEGELVDAATGEPLGIKAGTGFIAEGSEGAVEVVFAVPASAVAGRTVVCYETLLRNDHVLASHADIEDAAQTIAVPAIGTMLSSAAGDKTLAGCHGPVELVDTVSYQGLATGIEYRMVGTLFDRNTEERVGESIEAVFTPEEPDGTVSLSFSVDADECDGRALVAFEELYCGDLLLARHADLGDEGQTVRFASMRTHLAGMDGRDDVVLASSPTILIDTIAYSGLTQGETYQLHGVLMDKATETPLDIEAGTTFAAEGSSGTAEVVFVCEREAVAGKDIVAFETLSHDGEELLRHADLGDEGQTVSIPRIATSLAAAPSGRKSVEKGTFTLVDTISFENLVPGESYTVSGRLVDKSTGETFVDAKGNAVAGSAVFTPETRTGSCEVTFRVDASDIQEETSLVAFETISDHDGRLVASHEDLGSEAQTVAVTIPAPSSRTRMPRTGDSTDPVPMRIAAAAGAALAVGSTLVSMRAGTRNAGKTVRKPHRREKPLHLGR